MITCTSWTVNGEILIGTKQGLSLAARRLLVLSSRNADEYLSPSRQASCICCTRRRLPLPRPSSSSSPSALPRMPSYSPLITLSPLVESAQPHCPIALALYMRTDWDANCKLCAPHPHAQDGVLRWLSLSTRFAMCQALPIGGRAALTSLDCDSRFRSAAMRLFPPPPPSSPPPAKDTLFPLFCSRYRSYLHACCSSFASPKTTSTHAQHTGCHVGRWRVLSAELTPGAPS